ncbi:uncharacterized protein EI90DRAFT_3116130 [Cantharellus anzutake]|uniref:uncharacterized protein n=1 Tax=Cantharellus anzutake TaxID=1750568 RepID=UPI001905B03F|nr:uncharacterized protein EI90DRAFT_3116130 [Cantharellus anzutake]KAF8342193.1 hypothetical protein EI90DRAFT_3116130 [Cantharellus anzutake]
MSVVPSQTSTNPFSPGVHGHMTGPQTVGTPSYMSEQPPPFIPDDQKANNLYNAGPGQVMGYPTGSFTQSPPSSPAPHHQQSLPPNALDMQLVQTQSGPPAPFPEGGHHGGQTFMPPPVNMQQTGPPQSPQHQHSYDPNQNRLSQYPTGGPPNNYNQLNYHQNSWTGTSQQNNVYHHRPSDPPYPPPSVAPPSAAAPPTYQPQPPSTAPNVVVVGGGGYSPAFMPIMMQNQCVGGHAYMRRYGVAGIIIAIIFFPIGLIALSVDTQEVCTRCGHTIF